MYNQGPNHVFGDRNIRTVMIDGDPWVFLQDIAKAVSAADSKDLRKYLRDHDYQVISLKELPDKLSGNYRTGNPKRVVVSIAGLTRLMIRGNTPQARAFSDWLTDEVVPSLYRYGYYRVNEGPLAELAEKVVLLEAEVHVLRTINNAETLADLIGTAE